MTKSDTPQVTSIHGAPPHLTSEEYDQATSSTPQSFADIPPRLVTRLEEVTLNADPPLAGVAHAQGTLWVTEGAVSFLANTGTGFSLPYPLLALHAVSSSVPDSISTSATQCIYCQIDDAAAQDQAEGEDEDEDAVGLRQLWIVPSTNDQVEPLFNALSHCASLHPSLQDQDGDDSGGNPFAGMGPFGTGELIHDVSQFDDATEDADRAGLSETGRHNLARFDAMLDAGEQHDDHRPSSPVQDQTSESPQANVPQASQSNVIMVSSSPIAVPSLFSPPLLQSLLALLDAYLPVIGWDPQPEAGKMRVIFNDQSKTERVSTGRRSRRSSFSRPAEAPIAPPTTHGIQRIIDTLNNLPLETEANVDGVAPTLAIEPLGWMDISHLMPSNLSSSTLPSLAKFTPTDHLLPPTSDRNFLISPPGSPPIGWEPIIEDPPNRETLAGDLMDALKRLGKEMQDDAQDEEEEQEDEEGEAAPAPGTVHLVVPPSSSAMPAVTVQAYDDDEEAGKKTGKTPDITQVKATVDSMRGSTPTLAFDEDNGAGGSGKRITPTGRPPLA